jgi:DNA polymerase III delta prime subunit
VDPLYGRAEIIERAQASVDRACRGDGRVILFTGEPGIGKSTLAEHVAADAVAKGALVAWGRCWEAGGAPAYWPWIQVFRGLDMNDDPFAGAMADVAVGATEARFAAFDKAVVALRAKAAHAPLHYLAEHRKGAERDGAPPTSRRSTCRSFVALPRRHPYFHDNSHATMRDVIDTYSRFVIPATPPLHMPAVNPPELGARLREALSPAQKDDLLAFLQRL